MPVIGFLRPSTPESVVHPVEGQNVAIEYRWPELDDRLREIAAELVRREAAVIATPASMAAALAAKAQTTTIPVVFSSGIDPVKSGLIEQGRRQLHWNLRERGIEGSARAAPSLSRDLAPQLQPT
jgi:putative ABC transport system substrate-binding protein